jgi:hypothetical protein
MIPDMINASFEASAGFFVLLHCRALYRAKEVKGLSLTTIVFFELWGCWNMWYYPHLGQWWSFFGGILVVTANLLHVSMILYYRHRPGWEVMAYRYGGRVYYSCERKRT